MESLFLQPWQASLCYHERSGTPPAHVFLHELGSASTAAFPHVIAHQALRGTHSLLVDFLGFGFSDRPEQFSYTLEAHSDTIIQLLDHRGLKGCVLVGHGMGGCVAITIAAVRPDLVSRLVVAEPYLDPGGDAISSTIAQQAEESFLRTGYFKLEQKIRIAAITEEPNIQAFVGTLHLSARHALYRGAVSMVRGTQPTVRERLLSCRIPRAYIIGQYSLSDKDLAELTNHGINVLTVPNAGHAMMDHNPTRFPEVLSQALQL